MRLSLLLSAITTVQAATLSGGGNPDDGKQSRCTLAYVRTDPADASLPPALRLLSPAVVVSAGTDQVASLLWKTSSCALAVVAGPGLLLDQLANETDLLLGRVVDRGVFLVRGPAHDGGRETSAEKLPTPLFLYDEVGFLRW